MIFVSVLYSVCCGECVSLFCGFPWRMWEEVCVANAADWIDYSHINSVLFCQKQAVCCLVNVCLHYYLLALILWNWLDNRRFRLPPKSDRFLKNGEQSKILVKFQTFEKRVKVKWKDKKWMTSKENQLVGGTNSNETIFIYRIFKVDLDDLLT